MVKRKIKRYPGSIYVPKGRKHLRVKVKNPDYQPGNPSSQRYKVIASGLPNTPQGLKYAEEMLEQFWLQRKGLIAPTEKAKYTFQQLWEAYEKVRKQKLTSGTLMAYKCSFNTILKDIKQCCTRKNLLRFISEYIADHEYKASTFNNHIRNVKTIAKWAYRNDYLQEKLDDEDVKEYYLRVEESDNKMFTMEECEKLFTYLWNFENPEKKEFALLLKLLWMTGARISDVLTLTWIQVIPDQNLIIWKNKMTKRPEAVPISDIALTVFTQIKAITPDREKVFRWNYNQTHIGQLRNQLDKAMAALGIERDGRSFHCFRKTFINAVYDMPGIEIKAALQLVRHTKMDVSKRHYWVKDTSKSLAAINRLHSTNSNSPQA